MAWLYDNKICQSRKMKALAFSVVQQSCSRLPRLKVRTEGVSRQSKDGSCRATQKIRA